jgi:hypothetical protein
MRSARDLGQFAPLACALVMMSDGRSNADRLEASSPHTEVGTYPSNAEFDWSDNLQGITSDGTWWYISAGNNRRRGPRSTAGLYRAAPRSIDRDLGPPSIRPLRQPGLTGCSHVGDLDHQNDTIYVAIDGCSDRAAKVGMFRRDTLAYRGAFDLPGLARAGGVAWNPEDRYLYALNRSLDGLRLYRDGKPGTARKAEFVREIPLLDRRGHRFRGHRNQGLKFSPRGRAYIVFDDVDFARAGVYGFEIGPHAAQLVGFLPVRHRCTGEVTCVKNAKLYLGDELEGLLIEPIASGPYRGDLHVLMIDNDVGDDDVSFRHYGGISPTGGY